ncbi:hypothetical protein O6H91_01G062000 [Diphasiastrum complanatum]|uniref:Uncharacterized protein n=1 Tax=Diphasiastrum complanatum TaxID=34168 RepID=A0ACC2ERV7_DIPCM|nr:hypothetical protein O6H91_01G062000 [Diphasiastrum complanatum]
MVSVAIVSFAARVGLQVCVISLHTRAAPIYPPYASSIFCILEQPSAVAAGAAAAEEDVAAVAVSRSTAVDATTAEEAINVGLSLLSKSSHQKPPIFTTKLVVTHTEGYKQKIGYNDIAFED